MTESARADGDILAPVLERLPGPLAGWLGRSKRATQAVRDVVMMARGVLGPRLPLASEHRAEEAAVLPGERRLKVLSVQQETDDAVSLVLERPAGLTYEAGQFLTLVLPIEGKELRRSYSLSSSPREVGPLVITVKRVAGGVASRWLQQNVRPGMALRVRGPSGNFTYTEADAPGRLVLIGGGSGITPLMGILRLALAQTPHVPVTLLFANRSERDIIFRAEIARLAGAHPQLTVRHVLEQAEGAAVACRPGRIGRADLEEALGAEPGAARVYLCGPDGMMSSVEAELKALGLPGDRLKLERFVTVRPVIPGERRLHTLRVGPRQIGVDSQKTLLEGANEAGIELDFSCTMGGCGACKARLVSGEVVMDEPNCLSEAERAAGMVLTCVARPLSDVEIERLH